MDALTPTTRIHFYDTRTRGIACGVHGPEYRSTKHPRSVTCDRCLALVGQGRPLHEDASAGATA
jgi:hypothetical protein